MCTAAVYQTKDFYFGRTLDHDVSYGEEITVTPRNFRFHFTGMGEMGTHYGMIGMAHVAQGYPLYYDAVNEKGLGIHKKCLSEGGRRDFPKDGSRLCFRFFSQETGTNQ